MYLLHSRSKSGTLKRFGLLCFLIVGFISNSTANISLEGFYQGKNIHVQNPESEDGFGYCVKRVTVNGDVALVDLHSSAFQINFSDLNIIIGQAVFIVIEHDQNCSPNILNNECVMSSSTFEIESISCTPEGNFTWTTTKESGELNYLVEQYRWNKWVVIGEVKGNGSDNLNSYSYNVVPHSGENKVRVTQIDNASSRKRASEVVEFISTAVNEPELKIIKESKTIEFLSDNKLTKTKYEIFDSFGTIVKRGYNSTIDSSNLKPGVYYMNYDNKNERIVLR